MRRLNFLYFHPADAAFANFAHVCLLVAANYIETAIMQVPREGVGVDRMRNFGKTFLHNKSAICAPSMWMKRRSPRSRQKRQWLHQNDKKKYTIAQLQRNCKQKRCLENRKRERYRDIQKKARSTCLRVETHFRTNSFRLRGARTLAFAWLSFLYSLWTLTERRACTNKVICTRCSLKPDWLLTHTAPRHPPSQANKARQMRCLAKGLQFFSTFLFCLNASFVAKAVLTAITWDHRTKSCFSVNIYSIRYWF